MRASALVVWAALQYHGRWLLWLRRDRENARYPFFPAAVVVVIDLQTDDDDDYYDGESRWKGNGLLLPPQLERIVTAIVKKKEQYNAIEHPSPQTCKVHLRNRTKKS